MRPILLALGVLLAFAAVARAEKQKLAILDVSIDGDADPKLRTQLGKSLAGGFGARNWQVIPQDAVQKKLKSMPELAGCYTSTCLSRLAAALGARRFVRVRILADGASYTVTLELLAPDSTSGPIGRVEKTCSPCTVSEVNDLASRAAAELHEGAGARVPVRIATRPAGAALVIDGTPAGNAPQELVLVSGQHELVATLAGHETLRQLIDVAPGADGKPTAIDLTLEPVPGTTPHAEPPRHDEPVAVQPPVGGRIVDEPGPRRFGAWKWVAAGGAVVLVASGFVVLDKDGQSADCPPSGGRCASIYETTAGGLSLVGLGAAAAGVAVWMFVTDRPSGTHVVLAPTPGGIGVVASGHF